MVKWFCFLWMSDKEENGASAIWEGVVVGLWAGSDLNSYGVFWWMANTMLCTIPIYIHTIISCLKWVTSSFNLLISSLTGFRVCIENIIICIHMVIRDKQGVGCSVGYYTVMLYLPSLYCRYPGSVPCTCLDHGDDGCFQTRPEWNL